jgi:quercetin dioxygenase-like cupin family protein
MQSWFVRVVALAIAFAAGLAVGQPKPRMWADVLVDVTTEDLPRRARVKANLDHWEPGAETGRHEHPGPTVFVVLEGELEETLADGSRRTLTAGQGLWKRARQPHNVRNAGQKPARALAVHLDPVR